MHINLHDCTKNSRIYIVIYMWRRASGGPPCGRTVHIWDYVGEREKEKRGGEREKHPFVKTTRQARQDHSTSTARQSIDTFWTLHNKQEVMTEVSTRKVYRNSVDSLDVVSVY
jgi:hypothetical protein